MPIDASIPLQAQGPPPITMNSLNQMMQMRQSIQQQRMEQQTQNSLREIYSTPGALGADGLPNDEAIRKISQVSPQMGMDLQTKRAKIDSDKSLAQSRAATVAKDKATMIHDELLDPSMVAYESARKNGLTEEAAVAEGQRTYSTARDSLKASGTYSDGDMAQMPTSFDPNRVRAGAIKYKDYLGMGEKQKSDDRADRRADQSDKRMEDQSKRSDRQFALSEQRFGLSENRAAAADKRAAGGDYVSLSDDAIKSAAARYNVDGTLPPMGIGKAGAAARDQILNMAADKAKGTDPTDQRVNQLAQKSSAAARTSLEKSANNIQLAEKTALGSADMVTDLSKGYSRTSSPMVNRTLNGFRSNVTGDPKLTAFNAAVNTFKNEYTKVMSGSGQATDSARAEADHLVNTEMSDDQIKSGIGQMKAEMQKVREEAIQKTRELSTKSTRSNPVSGAKTINFEDL